MFVIEPVDIVDIFVHLLTKTNRLDVKIFEAFIGWIANEILSLYSHELRSKPCSEELPVEGLPELIMIVLISVFKLNN